MSYPWPSDLNRRSDPAAPALAGKCLHFEALESRILLSAEIGVPPSDPFADALLKDRYATLESRDIDATHLPAVMINQKLQSSIVSALERPQEKPHVRTNIIMGHVPLSWVMPDTTLLEANERVLHLTNTNGSGKLPLGSDVDSTAKYGRADFFPDRPDKNNDVLPLGSDVDLTAKYGHADFFPDRPDKNRYLADVESDNDLAAFEERLLRSGRAWLTPLASDVWIEDRHHVRSIEDLHVPNGTDALQEPFSDRHGFKRILATPELADPVREYTVADAQDFTTKKYGSADYIPDRPAKNSDVLPLGSDVESTAKYGHADFFPDRPDKNRYLADVESDNDLAAFEERLLRSGRAWLAPVELDVWTDDRHHVRSIEDLHVPTGTDALQEPFSDRHGFKRILTTPEPADPVREYTVADAQDFTTKKYGSADFIPDQPDKEASLRLGAGDTVISQALIPAPDENETVVVGTAGGDIFENDSFSTTFEGLAGNDIYLFENDSGTDTVEENPDDGEDTLDFSAVTTPLAFTFNADGSIDISGAAISVMGVTDVEILIGGQGDDTFTFLAGAQFFGTIVGGGGTDTLDYSSYGAGVMVDLGAGTAMETSAPPEETLTLSGIENITGSGFADNLTGDGEDNEIVGGDGADTLIGGAGDDVLTGGDGTDTTSYADANAGISVDLRETVQQDTGGAGMDTISEIENVIGSTYDDTLLGDDTSNILDGGDGVDTVSYATATGEVIVNLATQTASGDGPDTLLNFENIIGSDNNDTLTGDGQANVIIGGLGDDILTGGGGNDTVSYANAQASVFVDLAAGTGTVDTSGNGEPDSVGTDEVDTLSGFLNAIGSDNNDTIAGDGGDNVLEGGGGIDTLSYANALATGVTVSLSDTEEQATGGAGDDTVSGFENLTGSGFNDTLSGDENDNVLDGGSGGIDTVSYANATEGIVAALGIAGPQDTMGAGDDTLLNFTNLTGSAFDDSLTGDGFANVIDGGAGDDTLIGGAGNDDLIGGTGSDTVSYDPQRRVFGSISPRAPGLSIRTATTSRTLPPMSRTRLRRSKTSSAVRTSTISSPVTDSDNVIAGGRGNDTLDGGVGGNNTVSYANAPASIIVDLAAGTGTVDTDPDPMGTDEVDTLGGFLNIIGTGYGLSDPDSFGLGDTLTGTGGDNQFFVAAGADATVNDDLGNDSLTIDGRRLWITGTSATSITFDTDPITPTNPTTITYNTTESVTVENASLIVDVVLLRDGLQALANRFEELETAAAFVEAIPLADPLGAKFGDLQNFGLVLQQLVDEFDDEFISGLSVADPTSNEVVRFLSEWTDVDLEALVDGTDEDIGDDDSTWIANTLAASQQIIVNAAGEISEIRFAHNFTSDRSSQLDLSLSDTLRDADVAVARETFFNFLSGFELDFTFGLTGQEMTGTPDFFVDEGMQLLSNAALPDGLPVDIHRQHPDRFHGRHVTARSIH